MNAKRNVGVVLTVVALAYAVGRMGPATGHGSGTWAQEPSPPTAEMQAYREAATPGPRHRLLDELVGEWTCEFTIWMDPDGPPLVSRGTLSRRWVLDGRFLEETIKADLDEGSFEGVGYIGYSNLDGQYEMVWMDNMSTAIYTETGTYHTDTRILQSRGSHRDPPTGHMVHSWTKLNMTEPDHHTWVGHATGSDGRVYKAFEGSARRSR